MKINFNNTEVAFKHKSDKQLNNAYLLFRAFDFPFIVNYGPLIAAWCLRKKLPIQKLLKNTIFSQFCGGESIDDCHLTIKQLSDNHIGTILDYSVEGEEKEETFENTKNEIIKTIEKAKNNTAIPFCVFKVTGVARFALLEKINANDILTSEEEDEFSRVKSRINDICKKAFDNNVQIFIDAEESWIQDAIDHIAHQMMQSYNTHSAIVYNTVQLYRHDRLEFLKKYINENNHYIGFKLVRGAYMEKERERAIEKKYNSPIQPDKKSTDKDYNEAIKYCIQNNNKVSICAGTHNEESTQFLVSLLEEYKITDAKTIYFSQLLGMSDHISYNLAQNGYNIAKYVPYGPIISVLPYLSRRAQENSSAKGQAGRELMLITEEIKRRKKIK